MTTFDPRTRPLAPAGIGVTRLRVYGDDSPDGSPGGSPHFHLLCTEMYAVIAGHGEVETLSAVGVQRHELSPGRLVWFEPGVVHRLLNHGRDLDILVVMQNNGLPEARDFVLVFPKAILSDANAYDRNASLASADRVYATDADSARHRRDLAAEGYFEWRSAFESRGVEALVELYRLGLERITPRLATWERLVAEGPDLAAAQTQSNLKRLVAGSIGHLTTGRTAELGPDAAERLGMCGHLTVYPL